MITLQIPFPLAIISIWNFQQKVKQNFLGGAFRKAKYEIRRRQVSFQSREARHQFRSKKVRAFSNKGHQIGLRDFLWGEAEVCSPRRTARLARNWAVKSNGGAKSQETIFSEMRRFVITKLCIKINFYSNFLRKISRFAGLRRFFVPSPNISHAKI